MERKGWILAAVLAGIWALWMILGPPSRDDAAEAVKAAMDAAALPVEESSGPYVTCLWVLFELSDANGRAWEMLERGRAVNDPEASIFGVFAMGFEAGRESGELAETACGER